MASESETVAWRCDTCGNENLQTPRTEIGACFRCGHAQKLPPRRADTPTPASGEMPATDPAVDALVKIGAATAALAAILKRGYKLRVCMPRRDDDDDSVIDDALTASDRVIRSLTRELSEARARAEQGERDSTRMDWLERQHVEVRTPTRFGSWPAFSAHVSTSDEEGEWFDVPSDLRTLIDTARTSLPSAGPRQEDR